MIGRRLALIFVLLTCFRTAAAQSPQFDLYQQLRKFELGDEATEVKGLVLEEDRVRLTFSTGTFFFQKPINGVVYGAVFIGRGQFQADVPNSSFERQHVQRILQAQSVDSDFETVVLRFTDDTLAKIRGAAAPQKSDSAAARKLAADFDGSLLVETGINPSARLVVSVANNESPGIFLAQFDEGRRGRFAFVFDPQGRIPAEAYGINGGERGLIIGTQPGKHNDVWMAFYGLEDYQQGIAPYSDASDLVEPVRYDLALDVRNPGRSVLLTARLDLASRFNGVRAIPFRLNDDLPPAYRVKNGMRLKAARSADGAAMLPTIQEPGEGGVTVILPDAKNARERFSVVLELEGNVMFEHPQLRGLYYPLGTIGWVPRHGYLRRATYHMKFLHRRDHRVVTVGAKTGEQTVASAENEMTTEWEMSDSAALATFAVGNFEVHQDKATATGLPIEFYSHRDISLKEDFITAEMGNAADYFTTMFGPFPFKKMNGAFHPRPFGQGFPSLLMLAPADREIGVIFSFIAHETAHQWWGNVVSWRSYRDQWLSEGFAEYSGMLYTRLRNGPKSQQTLIDRARRSLLLPPETQVGIGRGKLSDVGPIVLGYRLASSATGGAATTLIYNKGALVLRMLHFLFTDAATGNGQPFFDMMKEFVNKHRGAPATNDSFRDVVNEHFARTSLAARYNLKDLNWFFNEWVYQTALPSYRLEYRLEDAGEGAFFVNYTLFQENAPQDWLMFLPLRMEFGQDKTSVTTVHVQGPQTSGRLRVPARPASVELDPESWVLSEKTSTREVK
jgi:hypothetical protein